MASPAVAPSRPAIEAGADELAVLILCRVLAEVPDVAVVVLREVNNDDGRDGRSATAGPPLRRRA
jgi:hypothetical protein